MCHALQKVGVANGFTVDIKESRTLTAKAVPQANGCVK